MKHFRKLIAVLLCLALALSLAACGSFEQRMLRAATKMEKLQSYRVDTDWELGMNMLFMGQSSDLDLFLSSASKVQKSPFCVSTELTTELMGESASIQTFLTAGEEEGSYKAWVSVDGGTTWRAKTLTKDDLPKLTLPSGAKWPLDFLRESAASFAEAGHEDLNGSSATRFDGKIEGEAVRLAVEASGVLDALRQSAALEGLDLTEIIDSLSGSIPVSLWMDDRSGYIVRYEMDLTEVMSSVWDSLRSQLLRFEGMDALEQLEKLGLELTLSHVHMSAVLSDFDAVEEIVLPEAANAA